MSVAASSQALDQAQEIARLKAELAAERQLRVQLADDSQLHLDQAVALRSEVALLRRQLCLATYAMDEVRDAIGRRER